MTGENEMEIEWRREIYIPAVTHKYKKHANGVLLRTVAYLVHCQQTLCVYARVRRPAADCAYFLLCVLLRTMAYCSASLRSCGPQLFFRVPSLILHIIVAYACVHTSHSGYAHLEFFPFPTLYYSQSSIPPSTWLTWDLYFHM